VVRTLGRMPPATRSEIRAPVSVSVSTVMATLLWSAASGLSRVLQAAGSW
jgi:hypothetical protein